jgi:hypothetical protein
MTTAPGWHPDPSGRHQHRFWDGTTWTDQVADNGVTGVDPLPAAPAQPTGAGVPSVPPVGGQAGGGTPGGWGAGASTAPTPPPSGGGGGKSRTPLYIGIAVVVAVIVAGVFLITKGGGGGGAAGHGAGDFTYKVGPDKVTYHTVKLQAGQSVAFQVDNAEKIHAAVGIDRNDLNTYLEGKLAESSETMSGYESDSNEALGEFLSDIDEQSDVTGDLSDASDFVSAPNFDGIVLYTLNYNEYGDSSRYVSGSITAPNDAELAILLIAPKETTVHLKVRVSEDPKLKDSEVDSDSIDKLYSEDFYSDFESTVSDDFSEGSGSDTSS